MHHIANRNKLSLLFLVCREFFDVPAYYHALQIFFRTMGMGRAFRRSETMSRRYQIYNFDVEWKLHFSATYMNANVFFQIGFYHKLPWAVWTIFSSNTIVISHVQRKR